MSPFRPGQTSPDRDTFETEAQGHEIIPVSRELTADWCTPVGAFRLLAGDEPNCVLLESVEGGERVGRYSFLGRRPFLIVTGKDGGLRFTGEEVPRPPAPRSDPLAALRSLIAGFRAPARPELPPFATGAVGYFGYDTVRLLERVPDLGRTAAPEPDLLLLFLSETLAFDHVKRRLVLTVNMRVRPGEEPRATYARATAALDAMEASLRRPVSPDPGIPGGHSDPEIRSNLDRRAYGNGVNRAKAHIAAGDVFQVVLSRRLWVPCASGDLPLYRALRAVNPSPYMFLLRFDDWSAVGSSPEPLLRVRDGRLEYRPIAGTAPRGASPAEDAANALTLSNDPKERAEHVMLVDLGRNDLGRCAVPGTVTVEGLMEVERYSHVMHLVSSLSARLRKGLTPLDALFACFPAGTVSGAPKVRAMELIEELEPDRRGLYGGAVGYLDFSGHLDTCIALRTLLLRDGVARIQAGAGIVADSDPDREYQETQNKAEALVAAVRLAPRLEGP